MLEKTTYFFPLASVFYLLVFYFSSKSKTVKIKRIMGFTKTVKNYRKLFEIAGTVNLLILVITAIIIFGKKFFNNNGLDLRLNEIYNSGLIFWGYLIIKFSYAWIIISEYESHKVIDELKEKIKITNLFKLELVAAISVFIYTIGSSIIFNSNLLLILSIISFSFILMDVFLILVNANKD